MRVIAILTGLVLIVIAIGLALTVPILVAGSGCSPSPCQTGGVTTLDVVGAVLMTLGALVAFVGGIELIARTR